MRANPNLSTVAKKFLLGRLLPANRVDVGRNCLQLVRLEGSSPHTEASHRQPSLAWPHPLKSSLRCRRSYRHSTATCPRRDQRLPDCHVHPSRDIRRRFHSQPRRGRSDRRVQPGPLSHQEEVPVPRPDDQRLRACPREEVLTTNQRRVPLAPVPRLPSLHPQRRDR